MKMSVGCYELSTREKDVVVQMPEGAEVLGIQQGRFGLLIVALVRNDDHGWVDWRFRWNNGERVEGLSSDDYVGSACVGPGDQWWHLFFVE